MDFPNLPRLLARLAPEPLLRFRRWTPAAVAAAFMAAQVTPAYATIDNTATVTGTPPSGPSITDDDTESVGVETQASETTVAKSFTFAPGGDVNGNTQYDIGDTVLYTYVVTNSGNVTIQNVVLTDVEEGVGSLTFSNPATYTDNTVAGDVTGTTGDSSNVTFLDGNWDVLGPNDSITYTSTYVIQAGDFLAPNGGSDGNLTNTATANATFAGNPIVTAGSDSVDVPLSTTATFTIAKAADDTTERAVGDVVTYTYTITNTGNVPITGVTVADVHNGSGPNPIPGTETLLTDNLTGGDSTTGVANDGTWATLGPKDVITFTATYTVTQNDVDTLQGP
jgi:cytochrome c oxidase assembly protein Cox11